jgi:hypothetical protein
MSGVPSVVGEPDVVVAEFAATTSVSAAGEAYRAATSQAEALLIYDLLEPSLTSVAVTVETLAPAGASLVIHCTTVEVVALVNVVKFSGQSQLEYCFQIDGLQQFILTSERQPAERKQRKITERSHSDYGQKMQSECGKRMKNRRTATEEERLPFDMCRNVGTEYVGRTLLHRTILFLVRSQSPLKRHSDQQLW